MTPKEAALAVLERFRIKYEAANHEPALTMSDCLTAEKLLKAHMPRNLFLRTSNKSAYALLICKSGAAFRTSSISRQAGLSRLSFASEEDINRYLGAYRGAVSPLGLIFDEKREIKVLFDKELFKEDCLLFHPLDNSCSVRISTRALTDTFLKALGYEYVPVDMN